MERHRHDKTCHWIWTSWGWQRYHAMVKNMMGQTSLWNIILLISGQCSVHHVVLKQN